MAFPVQRGTTTTKEAAVGTATATVPAITGITDGDLEIGIAGTIAGATVSIVGGANWALVSGAPIDVTGGEILYVWWRIHDSGVSTAFQVAASSDHVIACRFAFQAGTFDPSDPLEAEDTGTETTSDTSFSWAPATSTSGPDRIVCCIASNGRDSNTGSTPQMTNASLANLALIVNQNTANGAGGGYGGTMGELASAGSLGTFANTYAAASPKSYIAFAVKPAPAGTPHTADPDDSVTTSDDPVVTWGAARAAGDSVTPSDSFAREVAYVRAVNDSVTVSDEIDLDVPGGDHTANPSDTLGLADDIAVARALARTVDDTVSLADDQTLNWGLLNEDNNTVIVSDEIDVVHTPAVGHTVQVDDTLSLADAASLARALARSLEESLSLADGFDRQRDAARSVDDSVTTSDNTSISGAGNYEEGPVDTVDLDDEFARLVEYARSPADTLSLADALARTVAAERSVSDTLSLADALSSSLARQLELADTLSLADALTAELNAEPPEMEDPILTGWIGKPVRGPVMAAVTGGVE